MSSVSDLQAQLDAAKAEEAERATRSHRTLGEILHEFASVTGRHYLHEDIDALDSTPDNSVDTDAKSGRKAPVTTGKEGDNA